MYWIAESDVKTAQDDGKGSIQEQQYAYPENTAFVGSV